MRRALTFPTEAAALAHVAIIDRSAAYTAGGDLPLPRCNCNEQCPGDHSGNRVRVGPEVKAICICVSRETPDPACPFVTLASSGVAESMGEFLVFVHSGHTRAGFDVSRARELGPDEEPRHLPPRARASAKP